MNQNRSVATIDDPEFINVEPYNPLISQCEIKVLYLGENRNGSYINKNTAIQMANSLPGVPIVGAYRQDIEDFGDHGHVIKIEDGEVKFSCKTRPYGFVAPDAKVWFQKFKDTDAFGNEVEREYLMTEGYLWTGQYEEANQVIEDGKGQSMELDEATLKGDWATNNNSGMEFFIINDAIFSKLCILGDDVEPCFEGASVSSPDVSREFANNQEEFSMSLYTMMKELKDALNIEGGSEMSKTLEETKEPSTDFTAEETVEEPAAEPAAETTEAPANDEFTAETETSAEDTDSGSEEFAKKDDDDKDTSSDDNDSSDDNNDDDGEDVDDKKKKPATSHSLEEFEALQGEISSLRAELDSLKEFKKSVENQKKDALIAKYFMLSDEDKRDVIEHKSDYSLDEIDQKLAVIYVHKNVDFTTLSGKAEEEEVEKQEDPTLSFSLDDEGTDYVSPMEHALREAANRI